MIRVGEMETAVDPILSTEAISAELNLVLQEIIQRYFSKDHSISEAFKSNMNIFQRIWIESDTYCY